MQNDPTCGLPDHLFCKCENGTPCFYTCFEFKKYVEERVREEREKVLELWADIVGNSRYHVCIRLENGEPVLTFQKDISHQTCQYCAELRTKLNQLKGSDVTR